MINIPIAIDIDTGLEPVTKQLPPLYILQKMQDLCFQGYSPEEAEKMCEPIPLTDEEQALFIRDSVKQSQKEIRQYERRLEKEKEERMLKAISNKLRAGQ